MTLKSRIIGCGLYVPERVLTNEDLEGMVDTSDEWITTRTGIKERRIVSGERAVELATGAARMALKEAGIKPKDVELVVVGTVTPDNIFPSTACLVQAELGMKSGIPAFDVAAACSGFLYALDVADRYIKTGAAKTALVIGVDVFSRIIDWKDRATCVLFGDGAGAVVLRQTRGKSGILSSHIHSDGRYWEMLYTPGALNESPFEKKSPHKPFLKMKGNETFRMAVKTMGEAIKEAMKKNRLSPKNIALVIPHQANIRIINAIKDRLGMDTARVFSNIERYGNTSSASIPIALYEALHSGRIKRGDVILLVAFGGGFTWGATVLRW